MDRLKELRIDRTDKSSRKSRGGFALWVLAALLVAAGGVGFWWYARASAVEVRTARVEETADRVRAAEAVLDASGYVTARRRATVSSKVAGKIVEVRVEEGMEIAEGQLLARLDDSNVSRQLALAEAQLRSARSSLAETEVRIAEAKLNLERTRNLVAGEVASPAELDAAQAAHDALVARLALGREEVTVAERAVAVRRQELADTEIRAPFAGVAITKNAQPGEMISPISAGGGFTRTGICTIVDMASLEIEVDVNEAYINRVRAGQRVEAVLDAYPDWKIPASVITTIPAADRQKATVRVRIGFDRLDPRLLPDMGVKVSFLDDAAPEAEAGDDAPRLLIPAAALRREGGRDVVYVVRGDLVERRAVGVGERRGDKVEVTTGLSAGERVVVEAAAELTDGARVVVK